MQYTDRMTQDHNGPQAHHPHAEFCAPRVAPADMRTAKEAASRFEALRYGWRRARHLGIANLLRGFWLRRSFTRAGIIWVKRGWPFPEVVNSGGSIDVGNCGFYPGVRIECWDGAMVRIGKGTYLNRNTEIVASRSVVIGADCKIARDVLIMDTDQHAVGTQALVSKPIVIGDRVWLGSRVIVLKGVTIGHDSIVGAGAVVTKSVPPHSVVVGPAATVVRTALTES